MAETAAPGRANGFTVLVFYCILFIVPVRWQLGPATVGPLDMFAAGMGGWLLSGRAHAWRLMLRTPAAIPFFVYAGVAMASLGDARFGASFLKEAVKLMEAFVLYVGFAVLFYRERALDARVSPRAATIWIITFLAIVVIAGIWQVLFIRSTPDPWVSSDTAQRYFRFGWGPYALSNLFAGMLLLMMPLLVYRVTAMGAAVRGRMLAVLILVAFMVALLLTFSRGALAALVVGMCFMATFPAPGRRRRIVLFGTLVIAAGLMVATLPMGRRVFDFAGRTIDEISNERTTIWAEALREVKHQPLLGVGLGNLNAAQGGGRTYAHNAALQVAAETGALGVISFAFFIGAVSWTAFTVGHRCRDSADGWVFLGLAAALVMALAHNVVENTIVGGVLYGFVFWPLQAIGLAQYWRLGPRGVSSP